MKKIIVTLVVVFSFSFCKAQWVKIPDAIFAQWLTFLYPSCMKGDSINTTCPAIVNETYLICAGLGISNLTGIQYFDNLDTLNCMSNSLTSLPSLPASLTHLYCYNNSITSLPSLPASLTYLDCHDNLLTSLPTLSSSLTNLACSTNFLTSLPTLPFSLTYLDCSHNSLISLPALHSSLDTLDCSSNSLIGITSLPASITIFFCKNNPSLNCLPPLFTFLGTSSSFFDISNTGIKCLPNIIQHPNVASVPIIDFTPICSSTFNPNGCLVYTNVTEVSIASNLSIYPNPCTTCEIRGVNDANDIIVTDLLGKTLNASFTKTSQGFSIHLPNCPAGIYFVKNIRTGEAGKFVKE